MLLIADLVVIKTGRGRNRRTCHVISSIKIMELSVSCHFNLPHFLSFFLEGGAKSCTCKSFRILGFFDLDINYFGLMTPFATDCLNPQTDTVPQCHFQFHGVQFSCLSWDQYL